MLDWSEAKRFRGTRRPRGARARDRPACPSSRWSSSGDPFRTGSRPMPDRPCASLPRGTRPPIRPSGCSRGLPAARADLARSPDGTKVARSSRAAPARFEPPLSAIGPLFLRRLERIHPPRVDFVLDINPRATSRVLGGYYRRRQLIRIYTHDRETGRRPLEELFDTFLHEVAHHLEYTEPQSFNARACGRVPGRMHSELFWKILGELKARWFDLQEKTEAGR